MGLVRCGVVLGLAAVCGAPLASARPNAAAPPPISANPLIVAWTAPALLTGVFAGAVHDDLVELQERRCGSTQFSRIMDIPTGPDGSWHVYLSPPISTTYRARFRGDVTEAVTVQVRPSLTIRELTRGRFLVTALALKQFWRSKAVFERLSRGRWVPVKTVGLDESGRTTGTSSVTQGRFRSRLPRNTLVRVRLPTSQTRPCYQAGVSNMLRTR